MKLVVNDPHPSGDFYPADPAADFSYSAYGTGTYVQAPYGMTYETGGYPVTGYDGYSTGAFEDFNAVAYGDGNAFFGTVPDDQDTGAYGTAAAHDTGAYDTGGYATGMYDDTGMYDTGGYGSPAYDSGAYPTATAGYDANGYETGGYDTTGYDTGGYDSAAWSDTGYPGAGSIPQQYTPEQAEYGTPATADATGHWDASAYAAPSWDSGPYDAYDTGAHETGGAYGTGTGAYDVTGAYDAGAYDTGAYDTGGYDSTSWGTAAFDPSSAYGQQAEYEGAAYGQQPYEQGQFAAQPYGDQPYGDQPYGDQPYEQPAYDEQSVFDEQPYEEPAAEGAVEPDVHDPADNGDADATAWSPDAASSSGGPASAHTALSSRRRRSARPRRSALLTVAAPSVAVLGVAGIAAASVTGATGENGEDDSETTTAAAPDTSAVEPSPANDKLDTQLAGLSEDADDFADRASRTQERMDLKKRKEEERKAAAAEAARKEAERPKFVAPVTGTGISAQYGQAGVNWMSLHSGIDFPASYGTSVKAAADGTVSTKWGGSYGNMAIVTMEDGTELWYCHLSSTKIRSGSVKAGDVIAYSGNSGNSTGPHLHFEVRPGGGSAIDPMGWFQEHGITPG